MKAYAPTSHIAKDHGLASLDVDYNKVIKLIRNNRAGALATVGPGNIPHVALVYCIVNDDLSLYFSTRVESRKYHNLQKKPTVSIAFADETNMSTIQLTGIAKRVDKLELEQEILYRLISVRHGEPNWPSPPFKLFERGVSNELAIIHVVPREMTYASFKTSRLGRYKPFFQKVL